MDNFIDRFNWLIEDVSGGNISDFSRKTGIKQPTLYKYTKGRLPNAESLYYIRNNIGVDINWLLTGEGSPYLERTNDSKSIKNGSDEFSERSNVIELKHMDLVRNFIDKQRALNINRGLIELERLNPETFMRLESYIMGTVDMAREVSGQMHPPQFERRKSHDRRVTDDPDQTPAQDRRSGTDRRKAGVKR